LREKLIRSGEDIKEGPVHTQEQVERLFNTKFYQTQSRKAEGFV